MNKDYIYLDYAANTPVQKEVLDVFNEITLDYFANPNSTHELGKITKRKINETTNSIIELLHSETNMDKDVEIIYTSGSSESNNLAIKGVAKAYRENGKHIISTFLEHSSVSAPLTYLREQGYEIDIVNITNEGKVDHVDCTQAIGKIKVNLENVDLISFAPHKFYGLNGFGALVKNKDIVLEPLIDGGASTSIYRSGTPVIGQICALEKALEITFEKFKERQNYVRNLNSKIRNAILKYDDVKINTILDENPYILNISVNNIKATEFKNKLEEYGICVSIKSACTVTITPSRIVMAMTHDRKRALSSWRISLSHLTTDEEIDEFLKIFDKCYKYFKEG